MGVTPRRELSVGVNAEIDREIAGGGGDGTRPVVALLLQLPKKRCGLGRSHGRGLGWDHEWGRHTPRRA